MDQTPPRAYSDAEAEQLRQQASAKIDASVSILVEALHPAERRLVRQFPVALVRTGRLDPVLIKTPSGVPAIVIDPYFTKFLEFSNKVSLCTQGWQIEEIRNVSLVNVHSLLFGEASDTTRANRFFESMTLPSPEALEMYEKLNNNQHLFALAQVFSHLLHGDLKNATVSSTTLGKDKTKVDEIHRSPDAVFAADAQATNWCRTIFEKAYPSFSGDDTRVEISLQCGEIFLLYSRLAEVIEKNLGVPSSRDLPPAHERLNRIRRSSRLNMLKTFETFYFENIFPETDAAAKMEGKFPFCDWYMERAQTLRPEQIVEHFAECPRCKLTYDYLTSGT